MSETAGLSAWANVCITSLVWWEVADKTFIAKCIPAVATSRHRGWKQGFLKMLPSYISDLMNLRARERASEAVIWLYFMESHGFLMLSQLFFIFHELYPGQPSFPELCMPYIRALLATYINP